MDFRYIIDTRATKEALEELENISPSYLSPYTPPHKSYLQELLENIQDFTNLVPLKRTDFDIHLQQGGAYGYTILNHDYMVRDRYLNPWKAYETDVHELIHTPDEHETRELTRWMLNIKRFPNYYGNLY